MLGIGLTHSCPGSCRIGACPSVCVCLRNTISGMRVVCVCVCVCTSFRVRVVCLFLPVSCGDGWVYVNARRNQVRVLGTSAWSTEERLKTCADLGWAQVEEVADDVRCYVRHCCESLWGVTTVPGLQPGAIVGFSAGVSKQQPPKAPKDFDTDFSERVSTLHLAGMRRGDGMPKCFFLDATSVFVCVCDCLC